MDFKKARKISRVLQWGGLAVCLVGAMLGNFIVLFGGTMVAVASIALNMFYFRCPHCHQPLGGQGEIPDYCPHCGKRLD